jgi:hypothetical protein
MGSSLHNKIYLGRASGMGSRRMRALLAFSVLMSVGLAWMALRAFN